MKKARIENGVVRETLDRDPFPPFTPELQWVECGQEVTEGYKFDGSIFIAPVQIAPEPPIKRLTVESLADALKAKLLLTDADIEAAKK